MDGPRGLRPDELDSCLDVVNRVFRSKSGDAPTMGEEFPLLFAPENAGRLRVMADDGRVVCHIGVIYQTILVGGCELPAAGVGAVCTDPDYRGKGLATRTLQDAIDMMRRDGRVLLVISGGRTLYTRQGCVPVGRRLVFTAAEADLAPLADEGVTVRPRENRDVAAMLRIYAARDVRYRRTEETVRAFLAALEPYGNSTLMVEREGEGVVGYFVIRHGGPMAWWGSDMGRMMESAGDPDALVGALSAALDAVGRAGLSIPILARDEGVAHRLTAAGLEPKEGSLTGIACVLDAVGLVDRLAPWWREQLGAETAASVRAVVNHDGPAGLAAAGRVVETDGTAAFTKLLFNGECPTDAPAETEAAFRALAPALPVPLPDYGLNYV